MGGGGVELRTHLKPQSREERRQRRAASPPLPPSWARSLGLRRRGSPAGAEGGEGGPASRERHPGRGSHLGPERFSRQRRGRGGVRPVPRPTEAVHTSAPEPERRGEAAPHAPAPAQRQGGRASSPLRAAPRGTAGGAEGRMLPGGGGCRSAPRRASPPAGRARGSPGGSGGGGGPGGGDPQHPGLGRGGGGTLSRAPARACRGRPARGEPPRSAPGPPRAPPGPRCPALRPHVGAAAGPAAAAAPPLAAAAPDRPGEICQQFAATLVITFLESAAIDVKIRELPRLSAWNNLFAATYSSS